MVLKRLPQARRFRPLEIELFLFRGKIEVDVPTKGGVVRRAHAALFSSGLILAVPVFIIPSSHSIAFSVRPNNVGKMPSIPREGGYHTARGSDTPINRG